jgi:hypothetical protein
LRIKQILAWADAHHERTGDWPTKSSGPISEAPGETWSGVNHALRCGKRGLRGGLSLAELLQDRRGVRRCRIAPDLTVEQIMGWARAHFSRTRRWPSAASGAIPGSGGETWKGIDFGLRLGRRGLPGGSSVAKLLAERGRKVHLHGQRRLTCGRILRWADLHRRETGEWPHSHSGEVRHARGETWERVDSALRNGLRGLPGGSSLAQLLTEQRGARNPANLPPLSVEQILAWADAHHARTGRWPRKRSGPVMEASEETWKRIHESLRLGSRGLPGGSSLARLLAQRRGVPNDKALPRWTVQQILAWAEAHRARTGAWPTQHSGAIPEAPGESWHKVDGALRNGYRGLPGGSSLYQLLQARRGEGRLPDGGGC